MSDQVTQIGNSVIQHGSENDRIYLIKLDRADLPGLLKQLDALAKQHGYGKIFAKAPEDVCALFEDNGYIREAYVPAFYNGRTGCGFLGKYFSEDRRCPVVPDVIDAVRRAALEKKPAPLPTPDENYTVLLAGASDTDELAAVYDAVFDSYPFPIHDAVFVTAAMQRGTVFYCARHKGHIVAASSCEVDIDSQSAEMTDFATLPAHRGHSLSRHLLRAMEDDLVRRGLRTAYTIARAVSYGMNFTFARAGYTFADTLVNNTNIAGRIESMNVWYKALV